MGFETLRKIALFKDVGEDYLHSLLRCENRKTIGAGEFVFHQGDPGNGMYIVLSGKLEVISEGEQAHSFATIEADSFFGEPTLLTVTKRTAGIKALEDCELIFIEAKQFKNDIDKQDMNALIMSHNIALALADRLQKACELIEALYEQTGKGPVTREVLDYKKRLLSEVLI